MHLKECYIIFNLSNGKYYNEIHRSRGSTEIYWVDEIKNAKIFSSLVQAKFAAVGSHIAYQKLVDLITRESNNATNPGND